MNKCNKLEIITVVLLGIVVSFLCFVCCGLYAILQFKYSDTLSTLQCLGFAVGGVIAVVVMVGWFVFSRRM